MSGMFKYLVTLILILSAVGCSTGGNPSFPVDNQLQPILQSDGNSQRIQLGAWFIRYNHDETLLIAEPARVASAHYEITDYLLPPSCDDCLIIELLEHDPDENYVKLKISIRNPTSLTVFDVRGIALTEDDGLRVLNADAYTDLWDDGGQIEINPFRAYANDWPHREILPATAHAKIYEIEYPSFDVLLNTILIFDASWPGNCKEPYAITNFQAEDVHLSSTIPVEISVDVFDWQDDVDQVRLYAPEITGDSYTELEHYIDNTWSATIFNQAELGPGVYVFLMSASSSNPGANTLHQYVTITVVDVVTFTVSGIDPQSGYRGAYVNDATVTGVDFVGPDLAVFLQKEGAPDIEGQTVSPISPDEISCDFSIPLDAPLGFYDVRVENQFGDFGVGEMLFEVKESPFPDIEDVTPEWLNLTPEDVLRDGDLLFIAGGRTGLHIFDASIGNQPVWITRVELPGDAIKLDVSGGYACVAALDEGVHVVDIDPPETAHLVQTISTEFPAYDAAISGDYCYLATDSTFLTVIDISDPESASIVHQVDCEHYDYDGRYVAVSGDYAYLATERYPYPPWSFGKLHILDITDPENAFVCNTILETDAPRGLEAENGYVYLGCLAHVYMGGDTWLAVSRLRIYDVDPPGDTYEVDVLGIDVITDISLSNGFVYMTHTKDLVSVVDVSSPDDVFLATTFFSPGDPTGVDATDELAYVINEGDLHIYDITPPASGDLVGVIYSFGDTEDIELDGDFAYIADNDMGMKIMDITTPEDSQVINGVDVDRLTREVAVENGYAYIADGVQTGFSNLSIVDVLPPESAHVVNSIPIAIEDMTVVGGYCYAINHADFSIVDIDPPESASVIFEIQQGALSGDASVAVQGGYAYTGKYTLDIFDIDPPADAWIVNSFPVASKCIDIVVLGEYAYFVDGYSGVFKIADIDPPELTHVVSEIEFPSILFSLTVADGYAFVSHPDGYFGSIELVDISDVENPVIVASFQTDSYYTVFDIAVRDGYAYVACKSDGLRILKLW